jgi:ABC-type branched-subunit amino acid transport system substrate-binding protein
MRVRPVSVLVALFAMLLTLVAACGDDDDDSSSASGATSASTAAGATGASDTTGAAASSGPVRGVTDTEITIGGIASLTSPTGPLFGDVAVGAKARYDRANREGGVNGRMIKFLGVDDDGADASRTLDLARKQVLQQNVFAIAPLVSPTLLQPSADFLSQNGAPFAGWAITPAYCTTHVSIGFNGCLESDPPHVDNSLCGTLADALKMGEGTTVAYQGDDSVSSKTGAPQNIQCWEDRGATIVYNENNIPVTAVADYTPFAQAIMTSDNGQPPDVVQLLTAFGAAAGMSAALSAAGYKGAIVNFISYLPGALDQLPDLANAFDGVYVNVQWLAEEFGGPAIEQVKADLVASGSPHAFDISVAAGYWSADVFLQVLEAAGRDLSAAKITSTLEAGFTYTPEKDPPGLGPLKFPAAFQEPSGCSSLVRHNGTKYDPILPLTCFPVTAQR